MKSLIVVSAAVIGLLALLFATNPSRKEFDQELDARLQEAIVDAPMSLSFGSMGALACKLSAEYCLPVVKAFVAVTPHRYPLFSYYMISAPGNPEIRCVAILSQISCDGNVSVSAMADALATMTAEQITEAQRNAGKWQTALTETASRWLDFTW